MKILRLREVLGDDFGPDYLSIPFDQAPIRLLMEDRSCNPRYRERVQNSRDYRQDEHN